MWKKITFIGFLLTAVLTGDSNLLGHTLEQIQAVENLLVNPNNENEENCDDNYEEKKKLFNEQLQAKIRRRFDMTINDSIEKRGLNRVQIDYIIDLLVNQKNKEKNYYNLRNAYKIKTIDEKHILYGKKDKRIIALEDMYDTCVEIHKKAGYQGRETMLEEAKNFYGNVTRPIVELFLNFSEEYQLKRVNVKNNCLIAKPIKSTQFNQRWQIDLIDFRTCPDGEFNWIMTVQDHFTKFVWLKPLRHKSGLEVARGLIEIFGEFGAPFVLQSKFM